MFGARDFKLGYLSNFFSRLIHHTYLKWSHIGTIAEHLIVSDVHLCFNPSVVHINKEVNGGKGRMFRYLTEPLLSQCPECMAPLRAKINVLTDDEGNAHIIRWSCQSTFKFHRNTNSMDTSQSCDWSQMEFLDVLHRPMQDLDNYWFARNLQPGRLVDISAKKRKHNEVSC